MLKRIAITGPECTGKSWLAKQLSDYYHTVWVPEYSVEYLQQKGTDYSLDDILKIARGQLSAEDKLAAKAKGFLFCDTDLIVNKIWSKIVFDEVHEWIDSMVIEHRYDLYLLCYPDLEWQPSPFRENPTNREYLFGLYEDELKNQGFPYRIVTGLGDERLKNAVNFVDKLL